METGIVKFEQRPAVAVRRDMAMIPQVMENLQPNERSVFLAATAKNFMEYSEGDLATELSKSIVFIMKDVGYRDTSETERKYLIIRLVEILKRHYGELSMKDFRIAFEMSITGALDEFLPRNSNGQADRGHYQNFSAEYVCKILNAYKQKRTAVIDKAFRFMPSGENKEKKEYYENLTKQKLIEAYEYFKVNGKLPHISPIQKMLFYDMLIDVKLAKEISVSDEDCQSMIQRTMDYYSSKGNYAESTRIYRQGKDAPEVRANAVEFAREQAIKEAFENIKAKGLILSEYIV